ncbi:cytoplasmic protein, partial [bacterium]|nr:cytoplasmic protein [bacterium]
MTKIVFLVEEPSMAAFLEQWLPGIAPNIVWQCLPHEGKHDLLASIPRKLKGWREPGVKFIIIQDNDSSDCHNVKKRLVVACPPFRRGDTVVR